MTGSSVGIWKILIAYARKAVQNACINKEYRSWLLERNGEGKCVLRFYFVSVYINDLVRENGDLCSQDEFERMYNAKTNFIQFQGITNAIKDYARKHIILQRN